MELSLVEPTASDLEMTQAKESKKTLCKHAPSFVPNIEGKFIFIFGRWHLSILDWQSLSFIFHLVNKKSKK